MTNAKIVLFFSSGTAGWSEVYYTNNTSLDAAYSAAAALASFRARLMGDPTTLDAIRVEDPDLLRASTLTKQAITAPKTYVSQADNPNVAAMMRLYATGSQVSRPLYLRGNPDNAFDQAQPDNADAQAWQNNFLALGNFLKSTASGVAWQLKSKTYPVVKGPGVNITPITVVGVLPAIQSLVQLTTGEAHGLAVNDFVTLYKMGIPRLSGTFRVVAIVDDDNFAVPFHLATSFAYPGGGYMLKYTQQYLNLTSYANQPRWTRRATGRPFDVSRGRRRAIPR